MLKNQYNISNTLLIETLFSIANTGGRNYLCKNAIDHVFHLIDTNALSANIDILNSLLSATSNKSHRLVSVSKILKYFRYYKWFISSDFAEIKNYFLPGSLFFLIPVILY